MDGATNGVDRSDLTRGDPLDVLTGNLPVSAIRVLDIGCGDGWLVRVLAARGHDVTGIDPSAEQLALARAAAPTVGARYLPGGAESLPFDDASIDAVVFFNSLHHVPVACMGQALGEAARVLRPGALLYVNEPVAEGPSYELCRSVDDERELYARARDAIGATVAGGSMTRSREERFISDHHYADFETFCAETVRISPEREQAFHRQEADLHAAFERLGRRGPDGWHFDQVQRVDILRKS